MGNSGKRHSRRFASALIFCVAVIFITSLTLGKHEMSSKLNKFDWSQSPSTTASFKVDIPTSSIPELIVILKRFASQQGYQFTSRRVHPIESWYAIDLWNDRYAISGVNPVQATKYNFAVYVNHNLGGTDEEAKMRLAAISKLILEIQGVRKS